MNESIEMDRLTVEDIARYKEIHDAMECRAKEIMQAECSAIPKGMDFFSVAIEGSDVIIQYENPYNGGELDMCNTRLPIESFVGDYAEYYRKQDVLRRARQLAADRRVAELRNLAKEKDAQFELRSLKLLCQRHPAEAKLFAFGHTDKAEGQ